jgi:hypothetical protein
MNKEIKKAFKRYEKGRKAIKGQDNPLFNAIKYLGLGIFIGLILAGIIYALNN